MESILFFLSVFLAGVLSFFSPCIFPLLPVYAGVLLDTDRSRLVKIGRWQVDLYGLLKTFCFIAGLSVVFIILGYGAGFLGQFLYANWFSYVLGGLVILLGLHQMELINLQKLQFQKGVTVKRSEKHDLLSAFLLGLTFSLGWSPCVGPILSSVLALAASGGSGALQGGLLMITYSLGLSLPFLILALASSFVLRHFGKLKPYLGTMKKVGGFMIVLMGLLLMFGNINTITQLFG